MTVEMTQYNRKGFTLAEIMVVITILGVIAGLALPRFGGTMERVRASEGVQILTALLAAQKSYALENNGAYSTDKTLLDVTIDRAESFDQTTVTANNTAANVAQIKRLTGYILFIDKDGGIFCNDNGSITCALAGYTSVALP